MTSENIQPLELNEVQKLLEEFKSEYDRADNLCKEVQTFRSKASIPSINEMRYAGYHLRHSLDDFGNLTDVNQIRKARSHAQRACYEAAEAGIATALKEIKLFQLDYNQTLISNDVKNYSEILGKVYEAQTKIGVKRKTGDDQLLDHITHRELFLFLSQAVYTLNGARPEINKRMQEARTSKVRWMITTGIAILAVFVALFRDRISELLFK